MTHDSWFELGFETGSSRYILDSISHVY